MSSDWKTVTLGDVCRITKGVTYKGEHVGTGDDGLVSITSIRPGGGFLVDGVRAFSGPRKPHQELEPGDIVVALTDLTQTGKLIGSPARVVPTPFRRVVAAHHVARVEPRDGLDIGFAYYRLLARDFNSYAATYATGTTVRQVKPADLERFPFGLPPVSEQRRIAAVLGALDDKIQVEIRKRTRFEELIRVAGGALTREGADEWPLERLGAHYSVSRGLSYAGDGLANASDGAVPLHNLNSVREGGGYKYDGIKYYLGAFKDRHRVRPGDLVVANTEQGFDELLIGYPAIVPTIFGQEGIYSHHLHRAVPLVDSHLSGYWLYVWLLERLNHDLVAGYANGTTVNMLPADALLDPLIRVPPVERARTLDDLVGPVLGAVDASQRETLRFAEIRNGLLPRLVSGKIRVPESYDPDDVLGTIAEEAAAS